MSETGYTYSISGDFPSGINNTNLRNEINDSPIITKTLTYITIIGSSNQVRIFFATPLSSPTETDELDTIVLNHNPTPEEDQPEQINNIQPTSATGAVQISDFTFGNQIFQPFTTGSIENCTINASNNTISNISNANIQASANIEASKIADGSISNSEFQNLNNLTSPAVGTTQAQTLTNKTLTTPIISQISNIGTITLPTSTTTLVGTATTDTLTNKTIDASNNTITNISNTNISTSASITPSKINFAYFDAYNTASQTPIPTTPTFLAINFDVQRQNVGFTHTLGTSAITINTTGTYYVIARCTNQGDNTRSETQCRLTLDTGSGFAEVAGTIGSMYHRNTASNQNSATINCILTLSSTNQIRLETTETNGGVLATLPQGCAITILRIS